MKHALPYSFLAVISAYALNFALFIFIGNDASKIAMVALNIPIAFFFVQLYFKGSQVPSSANFAIIIFSVSIVLALIVSSIIARQGLTFLISITFWLQVVERIAMPFIYEKFFLGQRAKQMQPNSSTNANSESSAPANA